jgi:hypothetical protein
MSSSLSHLATLIKAIGPTAISQHYEKNGIAQHRDMIANQILLILKGDHPCQNVDDRNLFEEEDEIAELDALVISDAADLACAVAFALGPMFEVYMDQYMPLFIKYAAPARSSADRNMVAGCVAEIILALESNCTKFTNNLLPLFTRLLQDADIAVRNNAAFGMGLLCLHTGQDLVKHYPQILQQLRPLFDTPEAVGNACGAVSRMILRSQEHLPLDLILPVLVESLPLKKDFEENEPTCQALLLLLNHGNQYLLSRLQHLVIVFAKILTDNHIEGDIQSAVTEFIRNVGSKPEYQGILNGIDPSILNLIK